LKRALKGTYVSVEPFHLQAYCDEQAFRYNHRKATDAQRFDKGVREIVGKRLTYADLTGKVEETETIC
jgi:ISXO2-like transposase domain